jgi:hypothetical protein
MLNESCKFTSAINDFDLKVEISTAMSIDMKKYLQNVILDLTELAHMRLEKAIWLSCYEKCASSYSVLIERMFSKNQFDMFASSLAEQIGLSKEIVLLSRLLRNKILTFKPDENEEEILQNQKRAEIADIAYTILVFWSKLGIEFFPPEFNGLVDMNMLYNFPDNKSDT